MTEQDPKISRRYRELGGEEPPRALDQAILSAAHRAVEGAKHARAAPLVAPGGRSRWYFPLAAAAVIVLAVAVTVHVQREQPDAEAPGEVLMRDRAAVKPESAPQPAPARKLQEFTPDPKTVPDSTAASRGREIQEQQPAASAPAEASKAPAPPTPATDEARMKRDEAALAGARDAARKDAGRAAAAREQAAEQASVQAAPTAPVAAAAKPAPALLRDEVARQSSALAKFTAHSPEQWLQGIADLRRQGRHGEADKELAEFRKRHPDYRISESMLEKVEKK